MQFEFKNLGAYPSPKDYRDIPLAALGMSSPTEKEFFLDLSKLPVWHQKKIGACVGHAIGKHEQKLEYDETQQVIPLSARYLYARAKALDEYPFEGTYPRIVAKILKDEGCPTENLLPNDTDLTHAEYIKINVTPEIVEEAKKYRVKSYAFVPITEEGLKQGIKAGGVSLLVRVGKEWWTSPEGEVTWDGSKLFPIRPPKEIVSGHEIYLFGWDTIGSRTRFWFRNSWSKDWGHGGNGYFYWDEYKKFIDEGITFVDLPNDWLDEVHRLPKQPKYTFTKNLYFGAKGADVGALQDIFKYEGLMPAHIPSTQLFWTETLKAAIKFQKKHNISPALGFVGPITRAKLNQIYG